MLKSLPPHCYKEDGTRRIWRTCLRFLNVVEPGPEIVLSPTRIGMWVIIFVVPFIAISSPNNIAAVLTALGTAMPFVFNYIHQRYCDSKAGSNPNSIVSPAQS